MRTTRMIPLEANIRSTRVAIRGRAVAPFIICQRQYNHRGIDTMRTSKILPILVICLLMSTMSFAQSSSAPLRVAIYGLEHGHIAGFLHQFPKQHEVELVGIVEADKTLA